MITQSGPHSICGHVSCNLVHKLVREVRVEPQPFFQSQSRLGFHYFPDTTHYRVRDLEIWLPELRAMGASWLTLLAPIERAIPENFIRGLFENDIQPILHFLLKPHDKISINSIHTLFKSYARWGVSRVALFNRPNCRSSWDSYGWAQENLVERFLDQFIPLAELAIEDGLAPIFPPLEPGGDYWDLSFLRSAFRSLLRRRRTRLLDRLALGAYAWLGNRPLSWGLGGPDLWPGALPYQTSDGSQDQRGFRIFDWYLDIVKHEIGRSIPIFLLRAGALPDDLRSSQGVPDLNRHSEANLAIAKLLLKDFQDADPSEAIPDEVLACCFWLLASEEQDGVSRQAWVSSNGKKLPVVQAFYRLAARRFVVKPDDLEQKPVPVMEKMINKTILASPTNTRTFVYIEPVIEQGDAKEIREKPLSHYVLLPLYAWGAGDWDLGAIQPLLKENHPTVGFSLTEARLAARVTVIGGEGAISSGAIEMLKKNGCIVERVLEDGTLVAP